MTLKGIHLGLKFAENSKVFDQSFLHRTSAKMESVNLNSPTYTCISNNSLANHSTIYVGLVVDTVLDPATLREKAAELVAAWPILGGKLFKNVRGCFIRYSRPL